MSTSKNICTSPRSLVMGEATSFISTQERSELCGREYQHEQNDRLVNDGKIYDNNMLSSLINAEADTAQNNGIAKFMNSEETATTPVQSTKKFTKNADLALDVSIDLVPSKAVNSGTRSAMGLRKVSDSTEATVGSHSTDVSQDTVATSVDEDYTPAASRSKRKRMNRKRAKEEKAAEESRACEDLALLGSIIAEKFAAPTTCSAAHSGRSTSHSRTYKHDSVYAKRTARQEPSERARRRQQEAVAREARKSPAQPIPVADVQLPAPPSRLYMHGPVSMSQFAVQDGFDSIEARRQRALAVRKIEEEQERRENALKIRALKEMIRQHGEEKAEQFFASATKQSRISILDAVKFEVNPVDKSGTSLGPVLEKEEKDNTVKRVLPWLAQVGQPAAPIFKFSAPNWHDVFHKQGTASTRNTSCGPSSLTLVSSSSTEISQSIGDDGSQTRSARVSQSEFSPGASAKAVESTSPASLDVSSTAFEETGDASDFSKVSGGAAENDIDKQHPRYPLAFSDDDCNLCKIGIHHECPEGARDASGTEEDALVEESEAETILVPQSVDSAGQQSSVDVIAGQVFDYTGSTAAPAATDDSIKVLQKMTCAFGKGSDPPQLDLAKEEDAEGTLSSATDCSSVVFCDEPDRLAANGWLALTPEPQSSPQLSQPPTRPGCDHQACAMTTTIPGGEISDAESVEPHDTNEHGSGLQASTDASANMTIESRTDTPSPKNVVMDSPVLEAVTVGEDLNIIGSNPVHSVADAVQCHKPDVAEEKKDSEARHPAAIVQEKLAQQHAASTPQLLMPPEPSAMKCLPNTCTCTSQMTSEILEGVITRAVEKSTDAAVKTFEKMLQLHEAGEMSLAAVKTLVAQMRSC